MTFAIGLVIFGSFVQSSVISGLPLAADVCNRSGPQSVLHCGQRGVSFGSSASIWAPSGHFRSTPNSRHYGDGWISSLRAM